MAMPHVCVVGAGPAGLRCATVLLGHGCEVTIVEARDRIGGRVTQSDQMGPLEVDIGANWVHSTGYNPIVELAKATGTPLHLWKETTLMVDGDGDLVDPAEANKVYKIVWEILEDANEYATNSHDSIEPSASLYDFFDDWCNRALKAGDMSRREADLVLGMSHMWGAYVGDRVERQSLKYFYLEDCIHGDDCFIPTNYRRIMAEVAALPLAKAHVQLQTVMQSVEAQKGETHKVCLTTSDGKTQYFDDVVVTAPLGWLKKHKDSIVDLNPRIESAMDSMSFGRLEKVLIEFPTAFWDYSASDNITANEGGVSFVHWLTPSYAAKTNPQKWRLESVSFHAFEEPYRRNIMLFYIYGDCATYITTSVHALQGAERDEWLRDFFEPYYSRLPGYNESCAPLRFLATEWINDEFCGNGCYCNFQVGMQDAAGDVEAIRHGMPEKHIYFAGEHTAPFDGLGTVAGAYTSGNRIATRIVSSHHTKSSDVNGAGVENRANTD